MTTRKNCRWMGISTRLLILCLVFSLISIFSLLIIGQSMDDLYNRDEPPEKEWVKCRSAHYVLKTTAPEKEGRKLLDRMEIVFDGFSKLLGWTGALGKPFDIKVYKNRAQFVAGGAPSSAGAFYSPEERYLCGFFSKNKEKIYNYFTHEGIHQFHHMIFGMPYEDMKNGLPIWYDEGIADCMGNSEIKSGKFRMCVHRGPIAQGRLPIIQRSIKSQKYFPLKDLIKLDRQTFMGQASLCYAESWSFIHFLITYPGKEDKNKPYPAGEYFYIMGRLFKGFQEYMKFTGGKVKDTEFKSLDDVYSYAFRTKDGKTPISLDELEEKWKNYVMKFHYRDGADGIKDEEADKLLISTIDSFKTGKLEETQKSLAELKSKYSGTMPVTESKSDIDQLGKICDLAAKGGAAGTTSINEVKLFNGKDINNWEQDEDDEGAAGWRVENGAIVCDSDSAFLMIKEPSSLDSSLTISFKFGSSDKSVGNVV